MSAFTNETAISIEGRFAAGETVECELGSLIAAASDWTEDEAELDDLLGGLLDCGAVELRIG